MAVLEPERAVGVLSTYHWPCLPHLVQEDGSRVALVFARVCHDLIKIEKRQL